MKPVISLICLSLLILGLTACGRKPPAGTEAAGGTLPQVGPEALVTEAGESMKEESAPQESSGIPAETEYGSKAPSSTETEPSGESLPTASETEPSGESLPSEAETEPSGESLPTASETEPSVPETEPSVPETEPSVPETVPSVPETKPGLGEVPETLEAGWKVRETTDVIYALEDFGRTRLLSPYDADGDGIDDQTDILEGAKAYVRTRPVYDTSYFEGGWPPEGKGVCTDVAAFALLAAGYDLQKLLAADIAAHPELYPPGTGDANIDFRRTRNLLPFFQRIAESLTLDPYELEAWQPGDIVIFAHPEHGMSPGHIAIVSDRRASDGLPFLIHHTDNDRFSYEQDFLTTPTRILVGHFRMNGLGGTAAGLQESEP